MGLRELLRALGREQSTVPWDESGVDESLWAQSWEPGLSNDIVIFGKRVPLVQGGNVKLVRNFLDDRTLDFTRVASATPLVRPRKGLPPAAQWDYGQHLELLKEKFQFVVVHTDLTRNARKTLKMLMNRGLSSHFGINWNGIIYQYADLAMRTAHAGETNDISIGLDMNHPMRDALKKRDEFRNYELMRRGLLNRVKDLLQEQGLTGRALQAELNKYDWEVPVQGRTQTGVQKVRGYTPKQYEAVILLFKLLVRELDMEKSYPMDAEGEVIPHLLVDEDLAKLKGFVAHYHLSDQRWDPGPAFNWKRILSALLNEYNYFPVSWKEDLFLQGKSLAKANEAAIELYENTDRAQQGGTYPIGPNQTWHGGVHFFPPVRKDDNGRILPQVVRAMFDGTVVAAHFEPGVRAQGHNNFVLLRHELEIPKPGGQRGADGTPAMQELKFFTLYMHLDSLKINDDTVAEFAEQYERFTWLKRLRDLDQLNNEDTQDKLSNTVASYEAQIRQQQRELQEKLDRGEVVDYDLADLLLDVEQTVDDSTDDDAAPYLTHGVGWSALKQPSKVAALVYEDNEAFAIKVAAGEILGFTGLVRGREPHPDRPMSEEDHLIPGVHVEVFGGEETFQAIDLDLHGKHFRTPQRSRHTDLTVRTEDILQIFRNANRRSLYSRVHIWPEERIDPDEIVSFYARRTGQDRFDKTVAYREQLRRSITYHVSEWSDQVDWIASLLGESSWSDALRGTEFKKFLDQQGSGLFSQEVKKFLPYIWLTKELAQSVGLGEDFDGRVYHFHPVHWVMWVTYHAVRRVRGYRTRLSLRQLRRAQQKEEKIRELVVKGREALARDDASGNTRAFTRFKDRVLERALTRPPFGFPDRRRRARNAEKREAYEELRTRIINSAMSADYEVAEEDDPHGVIGSEAEPMYSNPGEVLQGIREVEPYREWKLGEREGDA